MHAFIHCAGAGAPVWERPVANERNYSKQVAKTVHAYTHTCIHILTKTHTCICINCTGAGAPVWERPAAKERNYSKQVAKTALKAGEEALNLTAWGNLRLGYKAIKMAATGYKISEMVCICYLYIYLYVGPKKRLGTWLCGA
jgi:hypothetical protein